MASHGSITRPPTGAHEPALNAAPQAACMVPAQPRSAGADFRGLLRTCANLNQDKPIEELLDDLLREMRRLVNADAGAVYLVDGQSMRFICAQNDPRPDLCMLPVAAEIELVKGLKGRQVARDRRSLAGYSAVTGRSLRLDDVYAIDPGAEYRFDDSYDRASGFRTRSMMVIPLGVEGGEPEGVLQVINRRHSAGLGCFTEADEEVAVGLAAMASLLVRNARLQQQVRRSYLEMLYRLATAAEFRDGETGAHIQRVSLFADAVAHAMHMPRAWCQNLLIGAPLHDVGKVAIPDAVLQKPGRLTDQERSVMQQHTTLGGRILGGSDCDMIRTAELIALGHHERWDGTGYPGRVAGPAIPLEARITAIADVFDALSSKRVYKEAMPLGSAFEVIAKERGTHFDPEVCDAFMASRPQIEEIFELYRESMGQNLATG